LATERLTSAVASGDAFAFEQDLSGIGSFQAENAADERRFARTGLATNPMHPPAGILSETLLRAVMRVVAP